MRERRLKQLPTGRRQRLSTPPPARLRQDTALCCREPHDLSNGSPKGARVGYAIAVRAEEGQNAPDYRSSRFSGERSSRQGVSVGGDEVVPMAEKRGPEPL